MKNGIALLLIGLLALPFSAQAQGDINPEIANCEALKDPATITQAEFCAAHPGCNMVLKIQRACSKVKTFFQNLKDLASGKSKPDGNDVLDALSPPPKDDATFRQLTEPLRRSSPPSKPQSQQGTFDNGRRWHYEGGVVNGQLHGKGVLIADNGAILRGEFIHGQQAGLGELVSEQSHKAGVMRNGLVDGPGVERFQNGNRYEGDFKAGKADGQGTLQLADGSAVTGSFQNGEPRGYVTYNFKDGTIYQGELAGVFHGQGIAVFNDGAAYRGGWENGKFSGAGRQRTSNGDGYEGQFKEGKRHGQGKLILGSFESFYVEYRDGALFNANIQTMDRRIDARIVNGVRQSNQQERMTASVESGESGVDWGRLAQGLIGAAGAYAAARTGSSGVVPMPAPLPPVQYKPYGTPAPVAQAVAGQGNSNQRVYYPMLTCVSAQRTESGGTCAKNDCGKQVTVYWQSAQTGVGAGSCYPTFSNFGSLLGACESGDSLDKSLRMCRK
jgi:hypothetical protein